MNTGEPNKTKKQDMKAAQHSHTNKNLSTPPPVTGDGCPEPRGATITRDAASKTEQHPRPRWPAQRSRYPQGPCTGRIHSGIAGGTSLPPRTAVSLPSLEDQIRRSSRRPCTYAGHLNTFQHRLMLSMWCSPGNGPIDGMAMPTERVGTGRPKASARRAR